METVEEELQLVVEGFSVSREMCMSQGMPEGLNQRSTSYRVRGNLRPPITIPVTVLIRKLRPRRVKRLVQVLHGKLVAEHIPSLYRKENLGVFPPGMKMESKR